MSLNLEEAGTVKDEQLPIFGLRQGIVVLSVPEIDRLEASVSLAAVEKHCVRPIAGSCHDCACTMSAGRRRRRADLTTPLEQGVQEDFQDSII